MLPAFAALLVACAAPAAAPPAPSPSSATLADDDAGRLRIAILGLKNNGVEPRLVAEVVDALALVLSRHEGTEVLTAADIEAVLGLEATKQALDCDEGSCAAMNEITRALDVRYTIAGSIAPRDDGFYVYASLVDVSAGRAVKRAGAPVKQDDYAVALEPLAAELLAELLVEPAAEGGVVSTTSAAQDAAPRDGAVPMLFWIGAGAASLGVAGALAGSALWAIDDSTIRDLSSSFATKQDARDRYLIDQVVVAAGAGLVAVGAAVLVAGLLVTE